VPGYFLLQNLRFEVGHRPQKAIFGSLRHLCRSGGAITNGRLGPNFEDLS
jgi:hypothetical protein